MTTIIANISKDTGNGFSVKTENGVKIITLTRPNRKNAITLAMYIGLAKTINDGSDDPDVKLLVLTGTGDYFCSGNDLGNFTNVSDDQIEEMANTGNRSFKEYIASFINCKKPIIVLLNGSAIGVGVTILGLCDIVYATESATLSTPFSALGQTPEGCSSYTFPRIMGYAKASEMLYFNGKITAKEGEAAGLISRVFPDKSFQGEVWKRIEEMSQLTFNSLLYTKELIRGMKREQLHAVNETECARLLERWLSEDCMNAIVAYFQKRGKL